MVGCLAKAWAASWPCVPQNCLWQVIQVVANCSKKSMQAEQGLHPSQPHLAPKRAWRPQHASAAHCLVDQPASLLPKTSR